MVGKTALQDPYRHAKTIAVVRSTSPYAGINHTVQAAHIHLVPSSLLSEALPIACMSSLIAWHNLFVLASPYEWPLSLSMVIAPMPQMMLFNLCFYRIDP